MEVVGYYRTSPGTNDEGTSLPGQRDDVRDFCEEKSWDLVDEFEDEDVSGRKVPPQDRDGFSELLGLLSDRPSIEAIVCRKKDRISRSAKVLMTLDMFFEIQIGRDIEIYFASGDERLGDDSEPDDPMDALMMEMTSYLKNMLSELEAVMTAQSTQEALRRKKKRDEPVGSTPYGLVTDKEKFENRDRATEYRPDDRDIDHFRICVQILNDFESRDTDPWDSPAGPVGDEYGMDHSNPTVGVRNLWERRDLYREVAERHRPDLPVLF